MLRVVALVNLLSILMMVSWMLPPICFYMRHSNALWDFGSSFIESSVNSYSRIDPPFWLCIQPPMQVYADQIDVFMNSAANILVYSDVASCYIYNCSLWWFNAVFILHHYTHLKTQATTPPLSDLRACIGELFLYSTLLYSTRKWFLGAPTHL